MTTEGANPDELYGDAVGDGTKTKSGRDAEVPLVVESNASNYGAGAVTPSSELDGHPEGKP